MIRFLLLTALLIASPAFAICLDCNMRYDPSYRSESFEYLIFIIIHTCVFMLACVAWLKKYSVIKKTIYSLLTIAWSIIAYPAYIEINTSVLYLSLLLPLLVLMFLIIKYNLKGSLKDNADKCLLYILVLFIGIIIAVHHIFAPVVVPIML